MRLSDMKDKMNTYWNRRSSVHSGLAVLFAAGMLLWGCSSDIPAFSGVEPETGEEVALSFDLSYAAVTRAEGDVDPGVSADANETMTAGKMFRIYAYAAGKTDAASLAGSENYTVQPDLMATGGLKLYRGTYDMYLVSYNSSTEVPVLGTDNCIHVTNGKDFMYTKLENIVVQPDKTGESLMKVTLPSPFTRMGAQVTTTVAARNGTQPVQPTKLVVNYVKINGLRNELSYKLNSTVWEAVAAGAVANSSYTYDNFSLNTSSQNVNDKRVSSPAVLLPVDGTQKLTFDVNLTVSYKEGSLEKTMTDTYHASIEKSLLPGMTYQFDFSLTFYGAIIPTDLTLAIREWTTTDLKGEAWVKIKKTTYL